MFVKKLTIKYFGTSDIPTELASKDTDVILDYVEFILRNSNDVQHIGIDFQD